MRSVSTVSSNVATPTVGHHIDIEHSAWRDLSVALTFLIPSRKPGLVTQRARDDAEIGKTSDHIVDDRGAVPGTNLHVDERPLLTECAYEPRKGVMDDDRQRRYDHLPSLLRRDLPQSA